MLRVSLSLSLALCASLALTLPARAAPAALSATLLDPGPVARATEELVTAITFEDHAISIDGHVSDGVKAYRVILALPDAAARFRDIAARASVVGQLYAAVGLRALDDEGYQDVVTSLAARADARVPTRFGCLGGEQRVSEIVKSADAGAIRLAPGESLSGYLARHKSGTVDIEGGGYSALFAPPVSTR